MAVAFRSVASNASTLASVSVTAPAGIAVGDLLIAVVGTKAGPATNPITTPAGWTKYTAPVPLNTTYAPAAVFYKVATSSEPASYTFGTGGANTGVAAVVAAYSGVNTANPFLSGTAPIQISSSTSLIGGLPGVGRKVTQAVALGVATNTSAATVTTWNNRAIQAQGTNFQVVLVDEASSGSGGSVNIATATNIFNVAFFLNPDTTAVWINSNASAASASTSTGAVSPSNAFALNVLAIACLTWTSAPGTVIAPSGWTLLGTRTAGSTTTKVYWKLLTTADIEDVTSVHWGWTWVNSATYAIGVVAYGSTATSSPINTFSGSDYAAIAAHGWPSIAASGAGPLIAFAAQNQTSAGTVDGRLTQRLGNPSTSGLPSVYAYDVANPGTSPAYTHTENTAVDGSDIIFGTASGQSPPLAPTLGAPANASYQDLAAGFTFTETYNSGVPGNTQTNYSFRRKVSGGGSYEYWNAGTGAFQSTQVWNSSSSGSLPFAAGLWTDGSIYSWSFATQDVGGQGPFAADNLVTASAPPTATVTAPSGTFAGSSPTVMWTNTLQSGAAQTSYRVVVESGTFGATPGSGTTVWDSGVVTSAATSVAVGAILVNTVTYRFFVQVTETGGQTSGWAHQDATASFTPPVTPTLTATVDNTNARVVLVLTNNDTGSVSGGYIQYSDDGGSTWTIVRRASGIILASGANTTLYDYESTPSVPRQYRAYITNVQSGQVITSLPAAAGPVTVTITTWWVKDLQNPANNLSLCDAQENVRTRPGDAAAIYPAGRTNPLILKGPVHSVTSKFRTVVQSEAARTATRTLFMTQDDLLIQDPRGRQWYAEWVGDLTDTQLRTDQAHYALERSWVEVDVPS